MSTPEVLPPARMPVYESSKHLSLTRKLATLLMFCLAQFLDSFGISALLPAIPTMERSLSMSVTQSVWVISAYQLTFASFLLISGRLSDVYNPKLVFTGGVLAFGLISLGTGFVNNKILLFFLRALNGVAASTTIPSALTFLVRVFPDPLSQARAIGVFGGCGATGNILGLLFGAMLVQWTSFRWVFWSAGLVAISASLGCFLIIPGHLASPSNDRDLQGGKWRCLDLVGVSILTVAVLLFIFGVTSGSAQGWTTPGVLISLIVSVLMIAVFFCWETLIPADRAAIPPRTWFYRNFSVLFSLALLPFFWWITGFTIFTNLWQNIFHWSAISAAIHMLPIGITALVVGFTGALSKVISPKWILLTGLAFEAIATGLFALGGGRTSQYWSFIFPGFAIGSTGSMLVYTHTNIAIFQAAPPSMAGTVGAIFNAALEFGSAVGQAADASIEMSIEAAHGGSEKYYRRSAVFWFLLGIVCLEFIVISLFYRRSADSQPQPGTGDSGYGDTRERPECEKTSSKLAGTPPV